MTPDRRTIDLANRLTQLAANITNARDHITREYAATDGIAAASLNDGSRSTDGTSTVERTMMIRLHLAGNAAQINDDLDAIDNIISSCQKTCTKAIGTRAPQAEPAKCYIDPGLDGYLTPLHDGGFFDPTCNNLSRTSKPGPCQTCHVRLWRYRRTHEIKALEDPMEITFDSDVTISPVGVAHARPLRNVS